MKRLRKIRKGCRWIFILSVLALVLLCLLAIFLLFRQHAAAAAEQRPWDVLLLLDASNSMLPPDGQAPDFNGLRVQAASFFIARLGLEAQRVDHRLGVIHFGTESQLTHPLAGLRTAAEREALYTALNTVEPLGWTDPLKALALAYAQLYPEEPRLSRPELDASLSIPRRQAVILVTDGKPDLPNLTTPAQKDAYVTALRALVERFQARNCAIFTIAISEAAIAPDDEMPTVYRNLWQEIAANTPPAVYYEVQVPDDLPQVYHSITLHLLEREPRQPEVTTAVEGTSMHELRVEPDLQHVTFTVFKREPDARVTLQRPGGATVRDDDPDIQHLEDSHASLAEVWAIAQPREGTWTVTFQGSGHVMLWQDTLPSPDIQIPAFTLDVQVPTAIAATQPLVCTATVLIEHGDQVSHADIQVTAELRRAGFGEVFLQLHPNADGVYRIEHNALSPGVYTVLIRALREGREIARHEKALSVVAVPHLTIAAPQPGSVLTGTHPLTVTARVYAGATLLDAATLETLGTLTATLQGPGDFLQPVPLPMRADRAFEATPAMPADAGHYTLTLQLAGTTPEGLTFAERHAVVFTVTTAPPPPQPRPVWPLWLVAGGSGLGLAGVWMYRRRPLLEGQWRVLEAPGSNRAGAVLPVPPARRAVHLGGKRTAGPRTIALPGIPKPVARIRPARDRAGSVEVWLAPLDSAVSEIQHNERPLTQPHRLQDGDVVNTQGYRLRYENIRQAAMQRSHADQPLEKTAPARRWSM